MSLVAPIACQAPAVDAAAIWVSDAKVGRHALEVYVQGERRSWPLDFEEGDFIGTAIAPGGRFAFVRSSSELAYVVELELSTARVLPIRVGVADFGLGQPNFAAHGDALVFAQSDALAVVPLAPGVQLRESDGAITPLTIPGKFTEWFSAPQAPIVYAYDPQAARITAFRYPTRYSEPYELVELGVFDVELAPAESGDSWCTEPALCEVRVSVSADGDSLWLGGSSVTASGCAATRLQIGVTQPQCVTFPSSAANARLLSAGRESHVLIGNDQYIYDLDATNQTLEQFPALGLGPYQVRRILRGEGAALVSADGGMTRWLPADDASPGQPAFRVTNQVRTLCGEPEGRVAISEAGNYAAWICLTSTMGTVGMQSSTLIRVSNVGVERFDGVPMRTLEVDDAGRILLYTQDFVGDVTGESGGARVPRTLYVLDVDATLYKVDNLEPSPLPVVSAVDLNVSVYMRTALLH